MEEIKTVLPELPEPDSYCTHADCHEYDVYNADQMRAYAEVAVLSANANKAGPETIDENVQRNIDLLRSRSQIGIAKYGITTDKSGLTRKQWKQHLLEELLDAANYIQAELNADED